MEIRKPHTGSIQRIQIGSIYMWASVTTQITKPHIIDHDQYHVRTFRVGSYGLRNRDMPSQQDDQTSYDPERKSNHGSAHAFTTHLKKELLILK
jgi:hypothetical protein